MLWDTVISLVAVAIVVLIFWKMPDDDEAWQDEPGAADGKAPEAPSAIAAAPAPTAPAPTAPAPTAEPPAAAPPAPAAEPPAAASEAPKEPEQGA